MIGPRDRELNIDEETVEVLEVIEECRDCYDLDDDGSSSYIQED